MTEKPNNSVLAHLRANLWLLFLTVVICCVLYPLAVWAVGQALFRGQAQGSLIYQKVDGKDVPVGSALIAQPFTNPVYFRPRPSAVSYNAAASGGSNLGASSPKLRGRVAQLLGTVACYRKDGPRHGDPVGPEVERWFRDQAKAGRDVVTEWAGANPTLAAVWATSSDAIKAYVTRWTADHPDVAAAWKKDNPDVKKDPGPDDLAVYFLRSYAREHPATWPVQATGPDKDGKAQAVVRPGDKGADIQSMFFDMWMTEQVKAGKLDPLKDFEQVPADMATTSGSGLDPDISLANAKYQEDGVVAANRDAVIAAYETAKGTKATDAQKAKVETDVRAVVDGLLNDLASRPMFGLTGDAPLLNVLRLNLALKAKMEGVKVD